MDYPKGRYNLAPLALERGYNVHSLTLAAQLSYNTVKAIWHNKAQRADIDTLARLAHVLGVKIGDLLETEQPTKRPKRAQQAQNEGETNE